MAKIQAVKAREVLDSRGNPTVEAQVKVNNTWYRAIAPSGASTGKHEAVELRDNKKRYNGKGVQFAVKNVNSLIAERIVGIDADLQEVDDAILDIDTTKNKRHIGANALLAVSMASARAAAGSQKMHLFQYLSDFTKKNPCLLPVPQMNVINGGMHAGQKNDIQEHMIMPVGAKSFSEGLRMGVECYHELKEIIQKKFKTSLVGDEGGFVPPLKTIEERFELIETAVQYAGYKLKKDMLFAIDAAASEFYNGEYTLYGKKYSASDLLDYYKELCTTYPIYSIEDGFAEDDWDAWQNLTKELGNRQIVGDDLLVTHPCRIKTAIQKKACNALLLKINQIGTVTEALAAARLAQNNNWKVVVSHRSGETEDTFIADLAVALNAGQCKFGAPARTERVAKYNQLLRIEEALGKRAYYGLK